MKQPKNCVIGRVYFVCCNGVLKKIDDGNLETEITNQNYYEFEASKKKDAKLKTQKKVITDADFSLLRDIRFFKFGEKFSFCAVIKSIRNEMRMKILSLTDQSLGEIEIPISESTFVREGMVVCG